IRPLSGDAANRSRLPEPRNRHGQVDGNREFPRRAGLAFGRQHDPDDDLLDGWRLCRGGRDLSRSQPLHQLPIPPRRAVATAQPCAHRGAGQRKFLKRFGTPDEVRSNVAMTWDWSYAASIMPDLLFGVVVTVLATIACSAIALLGGLLIAIAQMNCGRVGQHAMRAVMEVFRGVPILVLLYFGFYALPEIGILLPGF